MKETSYVLPDEMVASLAGESGADAMKKLVELHDEIAGAVAAVQKAINSNPIATATATGLAHEHGIKGDVSIVVREDGSCVVASTEARPMGRPRGRPRKVASEGTPKRKPGRPRKVVAETAAPKKVGRPRKVKAEASTNGKAGHVKPPSVAELRARAAAAGADISGIAPQNKKGMLERIVAAEGAKA